MDCIQLQRRLTGQLMLGLGMRLMQYNIAPKQYLRFRLGRDEMMCLPPYYIRLRSSFVTY